MKEVLDDKVEKVIVSKPSLLTLLGTCHWGIRMVHNGTYHEGPGPRDSAQSAYMSAKKTMEITSRILSLLPFAKRLMLTKATRLFKDLILVSLQFFAHILFDELSTLPVVSTAWSS
jgi:hypothetical protein